MEDLKKALDGVKFIPMSVDDYISFLKYKADDLKSNRTSLGEEHLKPEPFFHGLPDVIANYRRHLLIAHGGKLHNKKWRLHYNVKSEKGIIHNWIDFTENEINTVSDNAFFEKLEGFIVKQG